jgi:hypothetical protein
MSTQQKLLTVAQVRTIGKRGEVEFVTRDASIQPDRYTFANLAELTAYLGQVLGARLEGGGIRGSMSRKGTYSRRAADGTQAVTFGDPVLDAISSAAGALVIGDRTIDLRESHGSPDATTGTDGGVVALDATDLKFTGIVNGAERWASDDGAWVQYRVGNGRMNFHAWKKTIEIPLVGTLYWSMGGEIGISGTNTNFEAAEIRSLTYMSVTGHPPCQTYNPLAPASARDDTYVDNYDWGINAQQPERVAVLCRAQWHHARFREILTAGEGCLNYLQQEWPTGFPPDWATIKTEVELNGRWTDGSTRSTAITVKLTSLTIDMSAYSRPAAHGSIVDGFTITVTFPDDATYTGNLQPPHTIRWSNGSAWTKIINTVIDLNGSWTDGSIRRAVISEDTTSLTIDMSDYDRPTAQGSIVDSSTITVTFPDDATYTGNLQPPHTIRWSNGSAWTKV